MLPLLFYHCGLATNDIVTDYNIGIEAKEYEDYLIMDEHQKALNILRYNVDKRIGFLNSMVDVGPL